MENKPLCSVVMSVYNGEEYLKESIDSILQQSYVNFEFIIIDDASTDSSLEIIQSYDEPRIILIQNNKNLFLAASLNKGIRIAKGDYIVRMDADDVSMPERLMKQVSFMELNPQVGISGTCSEIIGYGMGHGNYSQDDQTIKFKLLHECHLLHPTLIIRKELIFDNDLFYNEEFRKNQDYELFLRGIDITEYANLPDVLIEYRHTEENIKRESYNQQENIFGIQKQIFLKIGVEITATELELYKNINRQIYSDSMNIVDETYNLLTKMVNGNNRTLLFETKPFQDYLAELFENVCRNSTNSALSAFSIYQKSRLRTNAMIKTKITLILFLKIICPNF